MEVRAAAIPEVKLIRPARFGDHRGYFSEVYNKRALAEAGIDLDFVQDNQSRSASRGTLRGLHFQAAPASQAKLLRVLQGAVVDVSVDCRAGSPTYGRYVMVELTAESGEQVLCPHGFAHAVLTMAPDTEITYKVDAYWAPDLEGGLCFDDPALGIDWPIPRADIIVSDKDRRWPPFRELGPVFPYP